MAFVPVHTGSTVVLGVAFWLGESPVLGVESAVSGMESGLSLSGNRPETPFRSPESPVFPAGIPVSQRERKSRKKATIEKRNRASREASEEVFRSISLFLHVLLAGLLVHLQYVL